MIKADKYLKETIKEILEEGQWDKEPRTVWTDGTPAHTKFVTQKVFSYDISKGDFPINTLRTTALKGGFHDIEAIYIKQTNILEEMHPSIKSWWKDFTQEEVEYNVDGKLNYTNLDFLKNLIKHFKHFVLNDVLTGNKRNVLGATYGSTVKRYNLMNKLLKGLEENPFGRRHKISLWQEQQVIDDPKALEPCAGFTSWSVREVDYSKFYNTCLDNIEKLTLPFKEPLIRENKSCIIRYIDLTLIQRSQDYVTTVSINPAQYVMLGMMVANHLTFKTGIKHEVGKFLHIVQNCHIYDRHLEVARDLLNTESTGLQPKIELVCEPKDFYSHTIEGFKFTNLDGIKKLEKKLEIAI